MQAVAIVAISLGFVFSIVKMSLKHNERIERIKHGYPLDDNKQPDSAEDFGYVDMTGSGERRN